MKKVALDIIALHHSVGQNPNYAMVLGEVDGNRRLPIVIGAFEAQAIVVAMENMTPNRPLTHDLFKNTIETFEIELTEIVINNLLEGIFYSRLICKRGKDVFEVDSRTSDAVALAVRFDCPIFVYENILEEAGIVHDQAETKPVDTKSKPAKVGFGEFSIHELRQMLDKVLVEEDYEKAAKIRDEIQKRDDAVSGT